MSARTLNQGAGQDPVCPPHTAAGLAAAEGVVFLRRQQALLLRQLGDADRDAGALPAPRPAAHAEWLALIAVAGDECGREAADRVARLYEYHGRVAGSLERQRQLPLPPPASQNLRRLLADRLSELTDDAAAGLRPTRS